MSESRRRYGAKHGKSRRSVLPVVLAAAVITVIALAYLYGPVLLDAIRGRNKQNEMQKLYRGDNASIIELIFPSAHAEPQAELTEEPIIVHEDFADLYAANPHIVGWLTAGASIDYPVVQYDNSFYLNHDFFGEPDDAGAIFLNAANSLSPRDSVLLIHGHNMRAGTMFGDMDNYRDYEYLKANPLVTFRVINDAEDVYYAPIAAFDASMTPGEEGYFDIRNVNFIYDILPENEGDKPKSTEFEQYIEEMRAKSLWTSPVEADSTDEYIILVTCSYSHENGRMMLVCRRLRADETPESVTALFE